MPWWQWIVVGIIVFDVLVTVCAGGALVFIYVQWLWSRHIGATISKRF